MALVVEVKKDVLPFQNPSGLDPLYVHYDNFTCQTSLFSFVDQKAHAVMTSFLYSVNGHATNFCQL